MACVRATHQICVGIELITGCVHVIRAPFAYKHAMGTYIIAQRMSLHCIDSSGRIHIVIHNCINYMLLRMYAFVQM